MIYQLWMSKTSSRSEQAFAQKTEAEHEADMKALIAVHQESGAQPLIMCESGWANEEHPYWGVTVFPDLDSKIKLYRRMNEIGFYQQNEPFFTLLGTATQGPRPEVIQPGRIYIAWMVHQETAAYLAHKARSKEESEKLLQEQRSAMERHGGCYILVCSCYWANDAYYSWGCETFPNLEELQAYKDELDALNWPGYVPVTSILGTLPPMQESIEKFAK